MDQGETIRRLLMNTKTIAVVGLSSKEQRAGYYVPAYLQGAGYRILPVNPNIDQALGEKAYPHLSSIGEPVDLVQIFRRAEEIPAIVDEAIQSGAKGIWMQLGLIHEEAAKRARVAGLEVVMDACMMVEHQQLALSR
jgi:predicted CoA-binding protein